MAHKNPQPDPFDLALEPWTETLLQIEDQLKDDCQHIRELIHEVGILGEFAGRQFLEESERMILARRRQYHPLLADLLEQELDVTRIGRHLTALESLIEVYQQLVRSLYPHCAN